MTLFNNPKPTLYVIIAFVVAFIAGLAWHKHAAAAEVPTAGVTVSGGYTILRGPTEALDVTWRWAAPQASDARWETGLTIYGTSSYRGFDLPNNFFPSVRYITGFGHFDLGLGLCYLQNLDIYNGTHLNFSLSAGYRWNKWQVKYQHTSNAGTQQPNLGRDFLFLGRDL